MEDKVTIDIEDYIDLFRDLKELEAIKNLIKEYVIKDDKDKICFNSSYSFTEDLLKLIKYTDVEFYNELEKNSL